jgi:hypothetical protein
LPPGQHSERRGDIKMIVDEEKARRKQIFDAALAIFAPVIELLTASREAGAVFSLVLRPPCNRRGKLVTGYLQCRAFHDGVGDDDRYYSITLSPELGTCEIQTYRPMTDEEEEEYFDQHRESPGPEWEEIYGPKNSNIALLREKIEEALITDAAERSGGPRSFQL